MLYVQSAIADTLIEMLSGTVVGAHPFGGEDLSNTGPKAGGPHYPHRFATRRAVLRAITAAGGNAWLMAREENEPVKQGFAPGPALQPAG